MGRTLNLVSHSLSDIRRLLDANQPREAIRLLRGLIKIAEMAEVPGAEIYQLLGEAQMSLGQYRLARRYLRRSLNIDPNNAQTLYDLARAIECDAQTDASRAGRYFKRALELSPQSVCLLSDAGAYFVQMGREKKGLDLLGRAVDLAPGDVETLQTYIGCLCEAKRFAEARRVLEIARFGIRSDAVLAQLRDNVEFHQARQIQKAALSHGAAPVDGPAL